MPWHNVHARKRNEAPRRDPLASLMLVMPILLIYEIGMLTVGPVAMRTGADAWLRYFLDQLGFGQYFLLPLLTCAVLLGCQHLGRYPWRLQPTMLAVMVLEAALGGVVLVVASHAVGDVAVACGVGGGDRGLEMGLATGSGPLVSCLGAGIYEELIFRLMLIPGIALVLSRLGESPWASWLTASLVSSLLFAAAHYRCFVGSGDMLVATTFCFRFAAGLAFSGLFLWRGFGVAVAAHAVYDLVLLLTR